MLSERGGEDDDGWKRHWPGGEARLTSTCPKTAGTSVHHYFERILGPGHVGWLGRNVTLKDLETGANLDAFTVIGGHFTRGQATGIAGSPVYASTVRDPAERVVSYHRYMMRLPASGSRHSG